MASCRVIRPSGVSPVDDVLATTAVAVSVPLPLLTTASCHQSSCCGGTLAVDIIL